MVKCPLLGLALLAATFLVGCGGQESGPLRVSAIGDEPPKVVNPNLVPLDAGSAFLIDAVASGLVRFDAGGEIEPALAQSWVVSDDGLRYTFRLREAEWSDGRPVNAEQVAQRLRAIASRASRSPLKPVLGAISEIEAMTDRVIEISLKGPRPNLLQLLAQPEMAVLRNNLGTGPYRAEPIGDWVRLWVPSEEEDEDEEDPQLATIWLQAETASRAVAHFTLGSTDLVLGGDLGSLPFARANGVAQTLVIDPAQGLFGLVFEKAEGPLAEAGIRRALSMAIDRQALVQRLGLASMQPRASLLPNTGGENVVATTPDWANAAMPVRRELAMAALAGLEQPLRLRIAMPAEPGYRLLLAQLRLDLRLIGVEAVRVDPGAPADLRLVDSVAPVAIPVWYLRHFTCEAGPVCDPAADQALEAARVATTAQERSAHIATADQLLTAITPFISLGSPTRWSLSSQRVTGFRPNMFARHPAATLVAGAQ